MHKRGMAGVALALSGAVLWTVSFELSAVSLTTKVYNFNEFFCAALKSPLPFMLSISILMVFAGVFIMRRKGAWSGKK